MNKTDLIKLMEGLEDETDVLETLKDNEEIKGLIKPFDANELTLEEYKRLINDNKEIKGYYTSEKDRAVSKGIESFKINNLEKIVQEELKKKSDEGKSPELIALEELQSKFEALEKEKTRVELTNKYGKVLNEKGYTTDLLDYIFDENEDEFNSKLEKINTLINSKVQNEVQAKLNGSSHVPPKADKINTMTKSELLSKGFVFVNNFANENQEEYNRIMQGS